MLYSSEEILRKNSKIMLSEEKDKPDWTEFGLSITLIFT